MFKIVLKCKINKFIEALVF